MKPRVFVSSVMENFQTYREAARQGIVAAGGEPVLLEDLPSLPITPRTACLDAVASCDIYLVIIGQRGGWSTPSGKLAVEEEYEEAVKRKLPLLAFIEEVSRDKEAERLAAKLSDYVSGHFRTVFSGPDRLQSLVESALAPIVEDYGKERTNMIEVNKKLENPFSVSYEAMLRAVFAPEREGQLVDPIALESPGIFAQLMEIGHSTRIGLFSYEHSKTKEVGVNEIVITQTEPNGHRDMVDVVRLELTSDGILVIDTNVTGRIRRGDDYSMMNSMVIAEEDVYGELKKVFAFCLALFEQLDPYCRYDRMLYNMALSNIGHRKLEANPQPRQSYPMGMRDEAIVRAFDKPRLIVRADLRMPEPELEAVITMFRRRLR